MLTTVVLQTSTDKLRNIISVWLLNFTSLITVMRNNNKSLKLADFVSALGRLYYSDRYLSKVTDACKVLFAE